MLSSRYAPHLLAFLAPVTVIVIAHSYIGMQAQDCTRATLLFSLDSKESDSDEHKRMRQAFSAERWQDGVLTLPHPEWEGNYAVVQSYDAKKIYHRPERVLIRESNPIKRATEYADFDGTSAPIRHLYYAPAESRVLHAAYLLIYDSQPVDSPYLAQIELAPWQILRGTYPMTLAFVSLTGPAAAAGDLEKQAVSSLLASWRQYKAVCGG
jgi:hypothetical protein